VTVNLRPLRRTGATDYVVDVEHAPGFFGPDGAIAQREGGALRDDEHAAELRQACDDVVRQARRRPAVSTSDERSTNGMTAMEARREDAGVSGANWWISVRFALISSSAGPGCDCAALFSRVLRHSSRKGAPVDPSASKSLQAADEVRFSIGDATPARERRQE
jgi:hypothetical protein